MMTKEKEQGFRRLRNQGAVCCFISVASFAVTIPFATTKREDLGCDALCLGGLTSGRSLLSLIGAPVMGRVSDRAGRRVVLVLGALATLFSALVTAQATSIPMLWAGVVPSALFSHQYDALKAVLADAAKDLEPGVLAGAQGSLGMAAGLAFMCVSLGGILTTSSRVTAVAVLSCLASLTMVVTLPVRRVVAPHDEEKTKSRGGLRAMVSLPSARSPKGLLVLGIRCLAGFAFHLFQVIWQPSLKRRFPHFTTADTSKFMTFVGICYAASQGLVAQRVLTFAHTRNTTPLCLVLCCFLLCFGRLVAVLTTSLPVIYVAYAGVIMALGVFNAALTSAVATVAGDTERGGFFGILTAVESVCGILGPIAGGALARSSPRRGDLLVAALVVLLYSLAATSVAVFWRNLLLRHPTTTTTTSLDDDSSPLASSPSPETKKSL